MKIPSKKLLRREFGIRIKRILFGREIKKTSLQRINKARKHTPSGRRSLNCLSPRSAKLKIKVKLQGPGRAGRAADWLAMALERTRKKMEEEEEEEI